RDACFPFVRRELEAMPNLRAIVALGGYAWTQALRVLREMGYPVPTPAPKFGHAVEVAVGPSLTLIGSYHPSQQNTFTGRLTPEMLDRVFAAARRAIG
ncbi:MAG: uracil-DNA glycosylase, partial [Gemmatimonadetes bacterium]|nr:uracil-DNA glycosylase [Gemmatimonadota bacterium]